MANNNTMYRPMKEVRAQVLANVTIPMYFYNIILPQLGSYFDLYPVNFDNDPRACCPLHDEDTPSFRYYEDTSSFYCFGCQKGGNIINLHMYFAEKMNGTMPSKEEAISFLYNYFIKGKENETTFIHANQQKVDKEQKLNTDVEIVKFNYYRSNLEQSITFDKTLKMEVKVQLWEELDHIDILLSKNLIKADDAEQYLRAKVKECINADATIKKMVPMSKGETINV